MLIFNWWFFACGLINILNLESTESLCLEEGTLDKDKQHGNLWEIVQWVKDFLTEKKSKQQKDQLLSRDHWMKDSLMAHPWCMLFLNLIITYHKRSVRPFRSSGTQENNQSLKKQNLKNTCYNNNFCTFVFETWTWSSFSDAISRKSFMSDNILALNRRNTSSLTTL